MHNLLPGQNAEMAAMSELYYIVAILGLLIWNELESAQAFAYILCVCVCVYKTSEKERERETNRRRRRRLCCAID